MNDRYGSAPIIFMDEEKRKEWKEMKPEHREFIKKHLHQMYQESTMKVSIELLCLVYNDLSERLDKLEKEHE